MSAHTQTNTHATNCLSTAAARRAPHKQPNPIFAVAYILGALRNIVIVVVVALSPPSPSPSARTSGVFACARRDKHISVEPARTHARTHRSHSYQSSGRKLRARERSQTQIARHSACARTISSRRRARARAQAHACPRVPHITTNTIGAQHY